MESRVGQGDLGEHHRRNAKHKEEKSPCKGLTYIKKQFITLLRTAMVIKSKLGKINHQNH